LTERVITTAFSRVRCAALAVAVTALTAPACASSPSSSSTAARAHTDSITIAASLQLPTLDAILENFVPINDTIYDPLLRINPKGGLDAALATKWTANSDASQWTFTLRSGVKFHDGSPLSASDVVWTYQTIQATPTSLNKTFLNPLTSATRTSDTEIVFTFKDAQASWPRQATLIPIVPQKAYEAAGAAAFGLKPIGTGPYKVASFTPNQQVVLEANKNYWRGAPAINKVTELVIGNETTRLTGLQSRSVDVAVLSSATSQTARQDKGLTVQSQQSNLVSYIGFNTTVSPMNNLKFRQAVDLAIDRQAIAKSLFKGDAAPIGQLLAPVTFGYDSNIKPVAYDAGKAKQLVQQSGYDGHTITFTYPSGPALQQGAELAQAIEGYLKSAGINLQLKSMDQAAFVADWFARKLPGMFLFSFQPATLDADSVYNRLLVTTNYFTDSTLNQLYKKQAAQGDTKLRAATLSEMARTIGDNVYFSALLNGTVQYVNVTSKVKVTPRADGYLEPQFMDQP
jgi:peptide/nickel transport system substrate-binding protein